MNITEPLASFIDKHAILWSNTSIEIRTVRLEYMIVVLTEVADRYAIKREYPMRADLWTTGSIQ